MAFSPTVKTVAAKSFDVNKATVKICRSKKPVGNILFVKFAFSIEVILLVSAPF